jgi:PIN domain nuclease of toxin-antitoxin system
VTPLLLDTCAAIWLAEDQPMAKDALARFDQALAESVSLFISPITAWEVAMLNARGRLAMSMSPLAWFKGFLSVPGVVRAELSANILVASSFLPGSPPSDPIDRIIAATAREMGLCLVTRDKRLLKYARSGHIEALAC